jgi:Na+-translocating ferredoxin:NAD+ oxidoreductase RnfG subunit
MKIKKNSKVIRLTESDLKKIVKRTLKESSYTEMEQQNTQLPDECKKSHVKKVMRYMSESNSEKIKIQTGTDAGFTGKFGREVLIITDPIGKVCGCRKSDFFEGGV